MKTTPSPPPPPPPSGSARGRLLLPLLLLVRRLLPLLAVVAAVIYSTLLLGRAAYRALSDDRNGNGNPHAAGRSSSSSSSSHSHNPLPPAAGAAAKFVLPLPSSPAEHQALARFTQSFYCARFYPLPPTATALLYVPIAIDAFHPNSSRRPVPANLGMYVVGGGQDIVSNSIAGWGGGSWESDVSIGVLEALAAAEDAGVADPLFLDVGSNLGMHSIVGLAYGYRVMSIDALALNAHHFMSTLCRHPELMNKSTFIMNGLGASSTTCAIASDDINIGDGTVTCNSTDIARYKTETQPAGLKPFRQWLRIDPLDSFIDEDAWVVKMDVEGFELKVLRGATQFFTKRRIHFLVTEVTGQLEESKEMVFTLKKHGFSCSEEGWYGKRMIIGDVPEEVVLRPRDFNIWCIHPQNLQSAGLGQKAERALGNV